MARVAKTRNGGRWSESAYWSAVRSALRRGFRYWGPLQNAAKAARIAVNGPRGQKWAFQCACCGKMFLRKNVQIHHVVPCGELKKPEDLAGFLERLTCEDVKGYEVLCKACHRLSHSK